ncbi:hypothetical protein Nos7524_5428 [Nostoc sp. PCC 7524]|uniref:hypothetical protein n=1 Tax=Nostoc sp. (strain ATCC 29411 / PCC 7524) TaxID=28072 RepID=UPI00029F43D8|nr:hypothetical protein [Nostoc sp. PCC 7524]AFY51145.1 hypothetical protein Nos7524_5428 [Nostoc sp. PCC 7524]
MENQDELQTINMNISKGNSFSSCELSLLVSTSCIEQQNQQNLTDVVVQNKPFTALYQMLPPLR